MREQEPLARTESAPYRVWYASNRPRPFRIGTSFMVPLPPEAAFAIYVDRVTEWQTAVDLVPAMPAAPLLGRSYTAAYRFLGRTYTGSFRVRDADPPRSVTYEASGSGITVWYTTTFEPHHGQTEVSIRGDYELPSAILERIADRLHLERAIGRDIERANAAYRLLCDEAARVSSAG